MNRSSIAFALALAACGAEDGTFMPPFPPEEIPADALVGIFEGKFPCETCVKIKTALVLLQEPATGNPTRYLLRQNQTGAPEDSEGSWRIRRGSRFDPGAVVYELQPPGSPVTIDYLTVGPDILLLLDEQLRPRVGNAAYSFTLSRTR